MLSFTRVSWWSSTRSYMGDFLSVRTFTVHLGFPSLYTHLLGLVNVINVRKCMICMYIRNTWWTTPSLPSPALLMALSSVCHCTTLKWPPLWRRLWAGCLQWPTGATPLQTTSSQADMVRVPQDFPWCVCLPQSPWGGLQFLWENSVVVHVQCTT